MNAAAVRTALCEGFSRIDWGGSKVLLIVPDRTRTAPVGDMVGLIRPLLQDRQQHVDVIVASGTHPPLSRQGMLAHLGLTEDRYAAEYAGMRLMNHCWDDPDQLVKIGYHVRDYYVKQMDRFAGVPRAVMAVSSYLRGAGTYEQGVEMPRIKVSIASAIPRETCEAAGLGYVDPASVDLEEWRNREDEGILFVERGGETLYVPG